MTNAARGWARSNPFVLLTGVLLFGYLIMSRSFAHWGIGSLYIGEMALGAYLLGKPSSLVQPWLNSLAVPSRLSSFGWWLAISLTYGAFECIRGLSMGDARSVGEIFVYHLYPLYVLPGIWVGTRHPNFLSRIIPLLAWCHGVYGVLFFTVFGPMGLSQSFDEPEIVGWLGHPAGAPFLLLGLLSFQPNLWRAAVPLVLNLLVLIGMQRRAEWVAFLSAVTLWSYLANHFKRLMVFASLAAAVFIVGLLPGVQFPSPSMRGEWVSTWDVVGRFVAPFDEKLADELTTDVESHAATATWRSDFWNEIWDEMHSSESQLLFGLGYHYPLWELHPYDDLYENPIRTPHSILMFVLGYSGWVGLLVFVGLQAALARLLWKTYRDTGEPFGICLWTLGIVWALFDPLLERPMGAIPLYLLMGMAIAQTTTRAAFLARTAPQPKPRPRVPSVPPGLSNIKPSSNGAL